MSTFQVDAEMLGEAANRVHGLAMRLTDATRPAAVGELGDAMLEGVARRTDDAARFELHKVVCVLEGMGSVLRGAGMTYAGAEANVQRAATGKPR